MTDPILDEAAVAAAWDRNADRWTQDVHDGLDIYRDFYTTPAFLDFIPAIEGQSVIDLGCGEGSNTRRFARRGGRMTGVDLSEKMIAKARAYEAAEPLGITYEVASFTTLTGFADDSFDCALSTMALMNGPDFPGAMRATRRVLKPGGMLCISVRHPCFFTRALSWLRDEAGSYVGLQIGRYFESNPYVDHWRFPDSSDADSAPRFEAPRFLRTLAEYINGMAEAGLRIDRVEEPRPDEEMARQHACLAPWRQHAPLVLFIRAVK
jgi:ubiquinone/menaquinone biosynthesis C-methylase UbiE